MNYCEKTLLVLDQIKKSDENIIALFAFGSFVTNETSLKNYKEIRVFDNSNFILSKFNLVNLYPDIDLLCVSNNPETTAALFSEKMIDIFGHYLTANVISKEVFEKELFSDQPTAIKRILLYRKLLIIKGEEYLQATKEEVTKIESPLDKAFQEEFNFKKEYLKLFAKYNVNTFSISKDDYERLYPNLLKFITGKIRGGFPENRLKLVYPKPMGLKAEVDLSDIELKDLI